MIAQLADPAMFALAAGLIGLVIGSFLNVVIHRLPIMMERDWAAQCAELKGEAAPAVEPLSLARPRSRCPHCGHQITALFRSVNTPKALNPRPAQSRGSVMSSGSNWVSKSIPVSATSAAMNSIAPKPAAV